MRKATRRVGPRSGSGNRQRQLRTWTRRVHFYLGLYFLFFIWLFALSGLFLNHPDWDFTSFWERRQEISSERAIATEPAGGDLTVARRLMQELGIAGEINEIRRAPDGGFTFQVVRPGRIFNVDAQFARGRATLTEIDLDAFGMLDALHKFTGVQMGNPARDRDWLLTRIWSFAMDAVALGLILLVLSGLYLWYRLEAKRLLGLAMIGLGGIACGLFLFGLVGTF